MTRRSTETPSISVVVPTFARPDYLQRAISSVMCQTHESWELIVVDDNDPASVHRPETEAVMAEYDDPRIRYLRHERNRGGSAARNTGLAGARAPYVAFLDDDDEWFPEKLAAQVAVFESSEPGVGLVYAGSTAVEEGSGATQVKVPTLRGSVYPRLLEGNAVGTTSAVLCDRKVLERVGGFDESLGAFQDFDLYLRMAQVCCFEFVPKQLVIRHKHSGARITKGTDSRIAAAEAIYMKHANVLAREPRVRSQYLSMQGRQHIDAGNRARAVGKYWQAFTAHPRDVQLLAHAALAAFGPSAYQVVRLTTRPVRKLLDRWHGYKAG